MKLKSISSFNKYPLKYIVGILLLYAVGIFLLFITNIFPSKLVQLIAVFPLLILLMIREFETKLLALFFIMLAIYNYFDESLVLTHFILFFPFFIFFWLYRHPLVKFEKNILTLPFFLLLFSFLISTLFSVNLTSSLYKMINYTQAGFFFLYLTSYISTPEDFKKVARLLTLSLIIPLSIGIYQVLYLFDPSLSHVKGTFLSRNSFAPFLAFHFFLFLGLFLFSKKKTYKMLSLGLVFVITWVFLNTYSRGGLIGLFMGIAVFLFLMLPRRYKIVFPVFILVLIILFIGIGDAKYLARFDMDNIDTGTIVRIGLWESALRMFAERPILGFGPNTFHETFPNYFPAIFGYPILYLELHHRHAHNILLNSMCEQGIIGLITLLFSLVWLFRYFVIKYKIGTNSSDKAMYSLFIGFFVYFLGHNLVDTPMTVYHHINLQHVLAIYFTFIVSYNKLRDKFNEEN